MADLNKIADALSRLTVREAAELSKTLREKWGTSAPDPVLFNQGERTRTEPLQRGEGLFAFYDRCASPGYGAFRSIVNGWLREMPPEDRRALISRMRYGGDRQFGASLSELSLHAFILGSQCHAKAHPDVAGTTNHPDYLATDSTGARAAYVEVTTVNPPDTQEKEVNRENPIYNAINGANIPAGSALGYTLVRAGKSSPSLKPLVADVERWARENVDAAKTRHVSKSFTAGDWTIELDLFAGGTGSEAAEQAIGFAQLGGGVITPHQDLRDALLKKSGRYGALDLPYLIAVADGKNQLFSKDSIHSALTDAVFGDEIVQFRGGTAHLTRANNGFWHGSNGPQNKHVSGVLLLPETGLWKLREEKWQPVLAINPWTDRPLPSALQAMNRFEADDGRWTFRGGKRFADIVRLPDPWPPSEK